MRVQLAALTAAAERQSHCTLHAFERHTTPAILMLPFKPSLGMYTCRRYRFLTRRQSLSPTVSIYSTGTLDSPDKGRGMMHCAFTQMSRAWAARNPCRCGQAAGRQASSSKNLPGEQIQASSIRLALPGSPLRRHRLCGTESHGRQSQPGKPNLPGLTLRT